MKLLTAGDIHEVTGLSMKTLDNWCRAGVITPEQDEKGHGHQRRFTVIQAVALSHARVWSEVGVGTELLKKIVGYLVELGEKGLKREFKAKRNVLRVSADGDVRLWVSNDFNDWMVNVEAVYQHVTQKIEEEEAALEPNSPGRNRGLATPA